MEITIENHLAYLMADDVKKICAPLFRNFPISYFCYIRKYKDNSILVLISHRNWYFHYLAQRYPFLITAVKKMHTWCEHMPVSAIQEGAEYFNIHNGVVVEKKQENFIEMIEFASPDKNASPISFCSNKDLLNQFIFYFKDQADALIKKANKKRLSFPDEMHTNHLHLEKRYDDFYQLIKTKKMHLSFKSKETFLTKQEFGVISSLAEGNTIKKTAEELGLSPRTVEGYLNNVKNKTDCFGTRQLIDNFKKNLF